MSRSLARRDWVPTTSEDLVQAVAAEVSVQAPDAVAAEIESLVERNRRIHDTESINLNPASNVLNPRAEAMLGAGLGSRASLGYPGDKYEMGLEAIERIEIIAAELAAEVFGARHAEVRVGSGALANLYSFMATCDPGDTIIAPPASVGGHVTHHEAGAAGWYRLRIVPAPVSIDGHTVDVDGLRSLALRVRPRLITVGGSMNLFHHPVPKVRDIADEVGARVLFDAAHLSGLIAGRAWPDPLGEGAHLMTMSTYKSLGGPAGGLIVTNDAALAQRLDAIAYPGLTANFDAGRVAALAITLLDWKAVGRQYATAMVDTAARLATELTAHGVAVYAAERGATVSHQFALRTPTGGQHIARLLRRSNILASGIELPIDAVDGDVNGLRLGTPEVVRRGATAEDMPELANLISQALAGRDVAGAVMSWRARFTGVHYTQRPDGGR